MLPSHLVSRLIIRGSFNSILSKQVIKTTSANPAILALVWKRFKSDFPEDPHGSQKPMDPKQMGGLADFNINQGIAKKTPPKTVEDFANPDLRQFWHSYGFDNFDQKADKFYAHIVAFLWCTVVWAVFAISKYYRHDIPLNDWALREAYMEIKRREDLGLPLIDRNYIPPEKVRLPTEEELEGKQVYY